MRDAKKGIAEIVAVMLMIAIVIAGAIIFYVYSSGLFGSLQGAQPQQPYTAHIVLEYYDWTSLQTLKLTFRNTGTEPVIFDHFYVNATLRTPSPGTCPTATTTTALPPQGLCQVTLTISPAPTVGVAYGVKIVTLKGAVFTYSCIAGSTTS